MWLWLIAAIVSEVTATVALRMTDGFTKWGPVVIVIVGYVFSFYALAQALSRGMPLGPAYAIWSAVGITAISVLGIWLFSEKLSLVQVAGLAIIIGGIVVVQVGGQSG